MTKGQKIIFISSIRRQDDLSSLQQDAARLDRGKKRGEMSNVSINIINIAEKKGLHVYMG